MTSPYQLGWQEAPGECREPWEQREVCSFSIICAGISKSRQGVSLFLRTAEDCRACWSVEATCGTLLISSAACGVFSTTLWIQVIQWANSPSLAYQPVTLACCPALDSQIDFMCYESTLSSIILRMLHTKSHSTNLININDVGHLVTTQLLIFINHCQPDGSFCRQLDS